MTKPVSKADAPSRLAVYGLLTTAGGAQTRLGIDHLTQSAGPCIIPGKLYDLGRFPGLCHGKGQVRGELFEILDGRVWDIMDDYEDYYPEDLQASRYHRRLVQLIEPNEVAWVYIYRSDLITSEVHIPGGDWVRYMESL